MPHTFNVVIASSSLVALTSRYGFFWSSLKVRPQPPTIWWNDSGNVESIRNSGCYDLTVLKSNPLSALSEAEVGWELLQNRFIPSKVVKRTESFNGGYNENSPQD